jgi:long-chain acyl-CoA synthetase
LTVLTLLSLATGAVSIYTARFQPRQLMALVRKHRPTGFVGIPAMYRALLTYQGPAPEDFRSFRYLIAGGEPLSTQLRTRFEARFGVTICQGYGLTETGPVLNWLRPEDGQPESVGKALPGIEERVVDGDGKPLPAGEAGEIRVRGPNVMKGYFKLPEANARAFDSEGFFRTGDLGRFDSEGNLYITGRLSDLIIVAGENVYPAEVEGVINAYPGVADCAVLGEPDETRGQVVVAFVEPEEGVHFDESEIHGWCRRRLAAYQVPRRVVVVEHLPRTATGKVVRGELHTRP